MTSHRISKGIMAWAMIGLLVSNVEAGSLRVIARYHDPGPGSTGNFRNFGQLFGAESASKPGVFAQYEA